MHLLKTSFLIPYLITAALSIFLIWYFTCLRSGKFKPKSLNVIEWVVVFVGMALRLYGYFSLPMTATCCRRIIAIKQYSLSQLLLLGPGIKSRINDPFGILAVQKMIVSLFGYSEYSVRLFVLLCSLIAILLFKRIKNWFCSREAGLIALILFCLSKSLLVYAANINKYSSDVLVALLLLMMAKRMLRPALKLSDIFLYGILGALSIWCSHPAVFILGGILMALTIEALFQKEMRLVGRYGFIAAFWLAGFLLYYFHMAFFIRVLGAHRVWAEYLLPRETDLLSIIGWIASHLYRMFDDPMCLFPFAGIILFILGSIHLIKARRYQFVLLISPFLLVIAASLLRKFPLGIKVLIFLIPGCYLLIGGGWDLLSKMKSRPGKLILGVVVLFFLMLRPVQITYSYIKKSYRMPRVALLKNMRNHFQEGDVIYVHSRNENEFLFYNIQIGFKEDQYVIGTKWAKGRFSEDLKKLKRYKRIWFILHQKTDLRKDNTRSQLDQIGRFVQTLEGPQYKVYLYEVKESRDARLDSN